MFYVKKAPDIILVCPICSARISWGPDIEDIKVPLIYDNYDSQTRIEVMETSVECPICQHRMRPDGEEWKTSFRPKIVQLQSKSGTWFLYDRKKCLTIEKSGVPFKDIPIHTYDWTTGKLHDT